MKTREWEIEKFSMHCSKQQWRSSREATQTLPDWNKIDTLTAAARDFKVGRLSVQKTKTRPSRRVKAGGLGLGVFMERTVFIQYPGTSITITRTVEEIKELLFLLRLSEVQSSAVEPCLLYCNPEHAHQSCSQCNNTNEFVLGGSDLLERQLDMRG